ncbi:hypothetical protein [Sulfuricurvum sp.]|uniref:hypothetical protein n=1 Tax=Sulfuricurvum sp. TaxID=2025608 RepID=UPI00261BBDC9|nr:hypothetical protein [Sulfuricurvum sp.]MDD3596535.1 hypothetical protein [Sulfuricurvum sp.]
MRKIGFIRQDSRIKEVLPHSYHIHSLSNRRKMFLSMLNSLLPLEAQFEFSKRTKVNQDVFTLLKERVLSFLPMYRLRPEVSRPVTTILIHESGVINRFLALCDSPKDTFLSHCGYMHVNASMAGFSHPAAVIASLMVRNNRIEMLLDLDDLFTQTVFSRIKPQEGTRLSRDKHFIHISENGRLTRLHPRWKRVHPETLSHRRTHIERAFNEMDSDPIDAYYLVYPKMDDFTRHIVIQNHDENLLKIIPYSFTFCTKEKHV